MNYIIMVMLKDQQIQILSILSILSYNSLIFRVNWYIFQYTFRLKIRKLDVK